MDDQVQGVIKRADGDHDADGLMVRHRQPVERSRIDAHGYLLPMVVANAVDAVVNSVDCAFHLDPGIQQRLATLAHRRRDQALGIRRHQTRQALENVNPPVRAHPLRTVAEQAARGFERTVHTLPVDRFHGRQQTAIVGRADFQDRIGRNGAGNHERVVTWHFKPLCVTGPKRTVSCPTQIGQQISPSRSVSFMFSR